MAWLYKPGIELLLSVEQNINLALWLILFYLGSQLFIGLLFSVEQNIRAGEW